jgi:hypothetical protein
MMTPRERFHAAMHFEPVDHVPDREFGYWDDTLRRWHDEGLPSWVTDNGLADYYFAFEERPMVPVNAGLAPGFEARVVEETETYRIQIDGTGVKSMVHTDGTSSIPHYLEFPLRDRQTWERDFLPRLDPTTAGRLPDWEAVAAQHRGRNVPLGITSGSLLGWLRNWAGFEGISLLVYDDPDLVEEAMEAVCRLICAVIEATPPDLDLDFAHGWEDICFNHGPMLSPALAEKWMVPRYRRITDLLKERHGIDIVVVDCDGNIDELVPLWLDAGVNCMFPLEVASGTDPYELRRRHGDRVLLKGGVDKRALIAGPEAIDAEIARLEPLVREGGYVPHVDHRVPPDVSYDNYLYYLRRKRDTFGMPHVEVRTEAPPA